MSRCHNIFSTCILYLWYTFFQFETLNLPRRRARQRIDSDSSIEDLPPPVPNLNSTNSEPANHSDMEDGVTNAMDISESSSKDQPDFNDGVQRTGKDQSTSINGDSTLPPPPAILDYENDIYAASTDSEASSIDIIPLNW